MEFEELYQDVILDHSRRPRNLGELPDADFRIHGDNPSCGDEITLHIKFAPDDTVAAATFSGNGCSICMASASMMTQKIKSRARGECVELLRHFHELLTSETEADPDPSLGDLRVLRGVRKFPLRVKCATLPWHALQQALDKPAAKQASFHVDPTDRNRI